MKVNIVDFARNAKKSLLLLKEAENHCVQFVIQCLIILKSVILNGPVTPNNGHFHCEYPPDSEIRSHKIMSLKSLAQCQMTILTAFSKEADVTTEASYAIAGNIIRSIHPYTAGVLMKENILQVASTLYPTNKICNVLFSRWHCQSKLMYVESETSVQMLQCHWKWSGFVGCL